MAAARPSSGTIPSRKTEVQVWRRRSAVVKFWRFTLPATIVAILVALTGWAIARGLLGDKGLSPLEVAAIQMVGGRLFGRDDNGRAFLVAAERAIEDAQQEGRYTLNKPTFNLGAGRARANQGIYEEKKGRLILRGDVEVVDASGQVMHTQEAMVDTRTGAVTNMQTPGARGIQIESDMGKISADDYMIERNGEVKFKGRVRGTFNGRN
jgi:lipopolysaccharide export system protein LptC